MRPEFDAELATLEGALQEAGTATVQAIHGALVALQDWEPGVLDYLAGHRRPRRRPVPPASSATWRR